MAADMAVALHAHGKLLAGEIDQRSRRLKQSSD